MKSILRLYITIVVLLAFHESGSAQTYPTKMIDDTLVTLRQERVLKHFKHLTENIYPISVAIDIPVEGSEILIDSITSFFNETLYAFFDNGEERHLPYESVFSKNVDELIEHYFKEYAPFFQNDTTDVHEFGTDFLEIDLVAQTNTYVTYEVNRIFYGEGIECAKEWFTFSKRDGGCLREIVSNDEMLRFYREKPHLMNGNIWEHVFNLKSGEDSLPEIVCSVGLLEDLIVHQYVYAAGIFEDTTYPLDEMFVYLSQEAKDLIRQ